MKTELKPGHIYFCKTNGAFFTGIHLTTFGSSHHQFFDLLTSKVRSTNQLWEHTCVPSVIEWQSGGYTSTYRRTEEGQTFSVVPFKKLFTLETRQGKPI